jgi:hypothetical protein
MEKDKRMKEEREELEKSETNVTWEKQPFVFIIC